MTPDPDLLRTRTHGWTVEEWLHRPVGRMQAWIRLPIAIFVTLGWRQRRLHADRVPREGAVLSCPNHTHWVDAWVHALGHRRTVRYMGKSDLIDAPVLGSFLRRAGIFPVRRGAGDSVAFDLARLVLEDGQFLVVYPEGTRCRTVGGGLGTSRSGAARLALATGCTILPSATWGLQPGTGREHLPRALRWLPFMRRATTVYGEPFTIEREEDPSRERLEEVRDEIFARVTRAFAEARAAAKSPIRLTRAMEA